MIRVTDNEKDQFEEYGKELNLSYTFEHYGCQGFITNLYGRLNIKTGRLSQLITKSGCKSVVSAIMSDRRKLPLNVAFNICELCNFTDSQRVVLYEQIAKELR